MTGESAYRGLYLNLERSGVRRQRFEDQLRRLDLASVYRRFPAIDGAALNLPPQGLRPGEVGCFLSHVRALEAARGPGTPVHILEDDAVLSQATRPVLEGAIAARLFDRFDIVLTDILVDCHLGLLKALKPAFDAAAAHSPPRFQDFQIIDLAQQNFSCLTSYVVGAGAIERVLALYRQELASGPRVPADLFIRNCVHAGKLRAACIFPFVTSFALDEIKASTIVAGEGSVSPSVMALAVLRYSFFLERDLGQAKASLDAALANFPPPDPHAALINRAVGFVMSGDFKQF